MQRLFIVDVEAAIFKDNHYLIIKRSETEEHAPGVLGFPGGKVELDQPGEDVLELALYREIREEVGVEVEPQPIYIHSTAFIADDGDWVIGIVYLCKYRSGTPQIGDADEIESVNWMTAAETIQHPACPVWLKYSLELAEQTRLKNVNSI